MASLAFVGMAEGPAWAQPPAQHARAPKKEPPAAHPPSNKTRAAELFKKSADAYLHGDFNQAINLLDEAYALDPQPVLIYNKARAHEGLGHVDESITLYEKYLAQEPNSPDRGAIEQRLVTLRRQRDEKSTVEKERTEVEKERVAVEKEKERVASTPPSSDSGPPETPHKRSVLPYVVAGVGAAGLVTGTVFGLMALSRKDAATAEPVQTDSIALRDTGSTFATVSNIGFIAGGILVVAGAVWWVLDSPKTKRRGEINDPKHHHDNHMPRVGLGPGFITLGGTLP